MKWLLVLLLAIGIAAFIHARLDASPPAHQVVPDIDTTEPAALPARGGPDSSIIEPSERVQVASDDPSEPTPSLTFADALATIPASLTDRIEMMISGRKDPPAMASEYKISDAIRSKALNPDQKQLDAAQEEALGTIVADYNRQNFELYLNHRHLSDEALLAALHRGQIETIPVLQAGPNMGRQQTEDANQAAYRSLMQGLDLRFGKQFVDWGWRQFGTTGPDGSSDSTVVYYTRQQSPGVFENRTRVHELRKDRDRMLREFFAGLP